MENEKMSFEERRAAYVEAYEKAITVLLPDFDCKKDFEVSGSPWCLCDFQYANGKTVGDIIEQANSDANLHAPEIAENLAEDFENADNMPRIILTDDGKYNVYDVNNCLDVFGRCDNGLDFEAIKEAFNRTKTATSFEAFKELAQGFESITDLDDLYRKMLAGHPSVMDKGSWSSDLPNFGGADLAGNDGVWSWDETRLIVGTCSHDIRIVSRDEYRDE